MIGIFDSGVGGLTVVREVFRQLPEAQVLYFGDTARTPYGTKGAKVVQQYTREAIQLLTSRGATLVIAACNTASAVAYDQLKTEFTVPVFEVITPAVAEALRVTKRNRVGVIGTTATIESDVYARLLKQEHSDLTVVQRSCPLFVALVEENWIARPETKRIVRRYLTPVKTRDVDTLILGCTHYPFLHSAIQQKMGKRVTLVDPAQATVAHVAAYLREHPERMDAVRGTAHHFLFSDVNPHVQTIANRWLKRSVTIEEAHADQARENTKR